jgi:hypothetical protein
MASSDDDHVAGIPHGEFREDLFVFLGEDLVGFGESFFVSERFAVVDDNGGEPSQGCDFGNAFEMWPAPKMKARG